MKLAVVFGFLLFSSMEFSYDGLPIQIVRLPILKSCSSASDDVKFDSSRFSSSTTEGTEEGLEKGAKDSDTELALGLKAASKQSDESDWTPLEGETINKQVLGRVSAKNFQSLFLQPVINPHFLVAMPTTAFQYKSVYNKEFVSLGAEKELKRFNDNISSSANTLKLQGGIKHLFDEIDRTNDELVIVFAHSIDNGRVIVLPDGNKVMDDQIHNYCANISKVCVVLTCHGDDFEINGKITADDALILWTTAIKAYKRNGSTDMNIKDFIDVMRLKRKELEEQQRTKIFLSISGTVTGVSYYYSSEQR
ncbi:MAG: hypothetical protein Q8Q54_16380 [Methylococcales bacterium]|nr:hypothetical protein [Methylococcales bacterium]MDP3840496.1 hypothetical protein [Methylococcales bacterium]